MWTDLQLKALIKERKDNNTWYHDLVGTGKMDFWRGVASRMNLEFGTHYTDKQCREKFQNLVRCYRVSKCVIIYLLSSNHKLIYHIFY